MPPKELKALPRPANDTPAEATGAEHVEASLDPDSDVEVVDAEIVDDSEAASPRPPKPAEPSAGDSAETFGGPSLLDLAAAAAAGTRRTGLQDWADQVRDETATVNTAEAGSRASGDNNMDRDEYGVFVSGSAEHDGRPASGSASSRTRREDSPEVKARMEAQNQRLTLLTGQAKVARDEYARLSAGRARRVAFFRRKKGFGKEAIANAKAEYDASKHALIEYEVSMALEAGVDLKDLKNYGDEFAIGDAKRMLNSLRQQRLVATGSFIINDEGKTELVKPKTPLGRAAGKFYTWWGKRQNTKLLSLDTLKKAGVMGAAGAVVGVPAALAGSVILGPLAGGAMGAMVAGKITRGVMAHHLSRRSQGEAHIDRLSKDLREAMYQLGDPDDEGRRFINAYDMGNHIGSQTDNEIHFNRRRILASAAIAAAGGFGGQLFSHSVLGLGSGEHASGGHGGQGQGSGRNVLGPGTGQHTSGGHGGQTTEHHVHHHKHHTHHGHGHRAHGTEETLGHSGDTISHEDAAYLTQHGYQATDANVEKVTQAVLHNQGISWEQARHLPVGYHFRIPPHILEGINKED